MNFKVQSIHAPTDGELQGSHGEWVAISTVLLFLCSIIFHLSSVAQMLIVIPVHTDTCFGMCCSGGHISMNSSLEVSSNILCLNLCLILQYLASSIFPEIILVRVVH
jgi:hypothetical protein